MSDTTRVLVVASRTADSPDLLAAMKGRAEQSPCTFHLLLPPLGVSESARQAAEKRLGETLGRMREEGLEVSGAIGERDPFQAVAAIWDPRSFDEIIVSTLAGPVSEWLGIDLPTRLERLTAVPVEHVERGKPARRVPRRPTAGQAPRGPAYERDLPPRWLGRPTGPPSS